MTKEFLYTRLINKLESGNVILFLGAGVSFNSGIPLVKDIYKGLWDLIGLKPNERAFFERNRYSFEYFMYLFKDNCDISNLLNIFSSNDRSQFHHVLEHLVKEGYINTILTTNFDCLIEETLKNIPHQKFVSENISDYFTESKQISILKLHGCMTYPAGIKIAINNVSNHENQKLVKSLFGHLVKQFPEKEIVFWGYSFSDYFDIQPAISQYTRNNKITVINHKKRDFNGINAEDCYQALMNVEQFNLDSDDFVDFVNTRYNLNAVTVKGFNWEIHFNNWAIQDMSNAIYGTFHGLAILALYLGNFRLSQKLLRRLLKLSKRENFEQWEIGIKITMSSNYYLQGKNLKSYILCKWVIARCAKKTYLSPINIFSAYLNYSNVLTKIGKYKTSLVYLEKAMSVCKEQGYTSSYYKCLCNRGLIMDKLKEFISAIYCVSESIAYAEENGEYSSLCNRYGYLAEIYYNSGNINKAILYIEKAMDLSGKMGEKDRDKYLHKVEAKIMRHYWK